MQKTIIEKVLYLTEIIILTFSVNSFLLIEKTGNLWLALFCFAIFIVANFLPAVMRAHFHEFRLRICYHGAICLKAFLRSMSFSVIWHIYMAIQLFPERWGIWGWSAVICILGHVFIFWNGMISVYLSSIQLGIRNRAIGILCGLIPVVNLVCLGFIIKTVSEEVVFEEEKAELNDARRNEQVCRTKYPILLVHGVFFRDFKFPNYWGRIPGELEKNGAWIFYGNHQSADKVSASAEELTNRIKEIVAQTNCEKVNVIAHSKGGLDSRYAISFCGAAPYVASLTTINTPHRGCMFADYLLRKLPKKMQQNVASTYNAVFKRLGDQNPDFMAAVHDLTAESCMKRDMEMKIPEDIFCQSVGSKLNHAVNGKFPLNFTYHLVKYFDGPNDGLVAESSFQFGEKYTFLATDGKRGISHGDMIDLNWENIKGFDIREFYVQLIKDLKDRGL